MGRVAEGAIDSRQAKDIRVPTVFIPSHDEPLPPNPPPARYCSLAFPAYRFVLGCNPHPTRDPEGHSYGVQRKAVAHFDPSEWRSCTDYLYGVDLFNCGFKA